MPHAASNCRLRESRRIAFTRSAGRLRVTGRPFGHTGTPDARLEAPDAPIAASDDVDSLLDEPEGLPFTVCIVARHGCEELNRCLASVRPHLLPTNAGRSSSSTTASRTSAGTHRSDREKDACVRVFHADHFLGSAAGATSACARRAGGSSCSSIRASS